MDNASYRRGLTTVQRKLFMDMTTRGSQRHHNSCRAVANSQAIVMSDILHSKAQSLFADVCIKLAARGRPDVATQVNECFSQITEAAARYQHMDVTGWRAALSEATFDHFMDDFTKLGASLRFMFPLKLGTLIACGETSDVDTFSLHFGRAFHVSPLFNSIELIPVDLKRSSSTYWRSDDNWQRPIAQPRRRPSITRGRSCLSTCKCG